MTKRDTEQLCSKCGSTMEYQEFEIPDRQTGGVGLVKGYQCPDCPNFTPILEAPRK